MQLKQKLPLEQSFCKNFKNFFLFYKNILLIIFFLNKTKNENQMRGVTIFVPNIFGTKMVGRDSGSGSWGFWAQQGEQQHNSTSFLRNTSKEIIKQNI